MTLQDEFKCSNGDADPPDTPVAGMVNAGQKLAPVASSACSHNEGGLTCGCPGYVNDGAGYCRTCSHSGAFHL